MAESVNLDINVNVPDAKKVEEPFKAIEKSGVKAEKTVSKTATTYRKFTDTSRDLALKTAKTTTAQLALGTAFTGLGSAVGLVANKFTAAEKPVTKMTDAQKDLNIKMQVQRDEIQKSFQPLAKFGIGVGKVTSFVVDSGLSIVKWTAYIGLASAALSGFALYKGWKSLTRHRDAMEEMGDTMKILSGHMGGLEEDWRQLVRNIALASEVEFDDVTETIRQMSFYLRQSGFTLGETEMFLIKLHQAFQIYGLTTEQTSTSVRKLTLALEENQLSMSFIKDLEKTAPLAFNLLAEAAVNAGHDLTKYGERSHEVVTALGELADQGKLGREVMLEFNKVVLESAEIEKQWEERTVTAEQAFNRMGTAAREYFEILDWAPIVPLFLLKRPKVAATVAAFVLLKESAEEGFEAYHKYSGKVELERIKNLSGINKALDENIVKIGEATDSTKLLATFMDIRYGVHLQQTKNTNRNYKLINEASRELLGLLKEEEDLYTELYDTYTKLTDAMKAGRVNESKAHAIHAENIGEELKDIQIKLDLNEEYKKLLDDIAKKEAERARGADDIREKELPKKEEGILQSAASHLGRIFGGGTAYAAGVEKASAATKSLASDNDLLIRSLERVQETENVLQGDRNINAKLSAGQSAELIGLLNKIGEVDKNLIKTAADRRVQIVETGKSINRQEKDQLNMFGKILPKVTQRLNIAKQQAIAEKELEKTTKERLKNEESVVKELAQAYLNKYEGFIKAEEARQLAAESSVEMEKRIFEEVALTLEQQKSKELIIKKLGETSVAVSTGMQQREIEHNLKILETNDSLEEQEKVGVNAKNKIKEATEEAIEAEKLHKEAIETTAKANAEAIQTLYDAEENLQELEYDGNDWRTKRFVEEHNRKVREKIKEREEAKAKKEKEDADKTKKDKADEDDEEKDDGMGRHAISTFIPSFNLTGGGGFAPPPSKIYGYDDGRWAMDKGHHISELYRGEIRSVTPTQEVPTEEGKGFNLTSSNGIDLSVQGTEGVADSIIEKVKSEIESALRTRESSISDSLREVNDELVRKTSLLESELSIKDDFGRAIARSVGAVGDLPLPEVTRPTSPSTEREHPLTEIPLPPINITVNIDPAEVVETGLKAKDTDLENALEDTIEKVVESKPKTKHISVFYDASGI